MNNKICPVCSSTNLEDCFPDYSGTCIASNFKTVENASLKIKICTECGLIFNSKGIRAEGSNFYLKEKFKPRAALTFFNKSKKVSRTELNFKKLNELVDLNTKRSLLELGAGKGDFLKYFCSKINDWEINALEPNMGQRDLLSINEISKVYQTPYNELDLLPKKFDLIISFSVIEHVNNPLDFLQWQAKHLAEGGTIFIEVPNFSMIPGDFFCIDHLTKMTKYSLENLAIRAGLTIENIVEDKVPLYAALKKDPTKKINTNPYAQNLKIINKNTEICSSFFDSFTDMYLKKNSESKYAIFGCSTLGRMTPKYCNVPLSDIACYIDEDSSHQEKDVFGIPIYNRSAIKKLGITDVFIAVSPLYIDAVIAKLSEENVNLHYPKLS
ncbi:class I SAM-dependent methyltransferase [Desulfovibrio sp. UCD-KL4C]|uniref:class I SAM-dependent methyltransferase n=1 Tax=Desulfovibrio sp. UCD-KL4C TaxID=2578120 RepID=UPI0025C38987|nr:class I SAM-dependent methyltransferase [Desulfovibrio sp. UCD-KL4C]